MSFADSKIIGSVEVLRTRTYPLDAYATGERTEAVVEPGVYPLYERGGSKFWLMDGTINLGGMQSLGDGLIVATAGDIKSDIPVRFPSRSFGPDEWDKLVTSATCSEGDPEQRLRIKEGSEQ
jgi:hypothetical protein